MWERFADIRDIKHVVILMQENRSFDHYFGWYDVRVTISGDTTWSRRYTGHLETGDPSITG